VIGNYVTQFSFNGQRLETDKGTMETEARVEVIRGERRVPVKFSVEFPSSNYIT
jgi:hypothetical protein